MKNKQEIDIDVLVNKIIRIYTPNHNITIKWLIEQQNIYISSYKNTLIENYESIKHTINTIIKKGAYIMDNIELKHLKELDILFIKEIGLYHFIFEDETEWRKHNKLNAQSKYNLLDQIKIKTSMLIDDYRKDNGNINNKSIYNIYLLNNIINDIYIFQNLIDRILFGEYGIRGKIKQPKYTFKDHLDDNISLVIVILTIFAIITILIVTLIDKINNVNPC